MAQITITDLPLQASGHQFWVSSVDYFGNKNTSGMPTVDMEFPTLTAPSISNVTNIYSTYTEVDTLETTEAQEIYPVFDRVNAVQITPIVVTGITTTAQYFSHFEIQIDTVDTFDVSPSIQVPASTFSDPTYTSRPITFSCTDGTEYHFRVRIYDLVGNVSSWSSSVTETAGDTVAPNEVGSSNVDITADGHFYSATVDQGTYTQASDHAYYEWWTAISDSHPGGNGLREDDETFYFSNKSGQTIYLWCAAVDRSGNRSANYTSNVGNAPFVSADFWTETGDVTDLSGDTIVNVTDRGIEDENGVTIIDFTTGSGVTDYNAELQGAINFGTGGALHLTDNTVTFAGTPIVGMEILGRGFKLYQDADNYVLMEKTGASAINFEIMGGTFRTGSATSYLILDSTGIKSYNSSTQRVQILNDGSGWLGASDAFYWDTDGNVFIGDLGVTHIEAVTGTIAGWDITSSEINITPVSNVTARLNSSGYISFGDPAPTTYGNNAGAWLGMDSGTAKMSIYTDASNFLQWDGSTLTMTGADFDDGTITASTFQTAASGARVVISTANGIQAFNSTPVQTVSIDTDGSGWFGLTGTRAVEWTTAGVVTIAGWTATATEFSGTGIITGGTIRTGSGNARVELTSANGLRAFNSSSVQTADIDTDGSGWFGLTGTKAITWDTSGAATIGGWSATADLFRSATSAERIQLDASKNRISIFDAVNEKVVMGYLEGLGRNKAHGNATGGSSTYIDDTGQDWEIDQLIGLNISITGGTGAPQTRTITDNTATRIYASFSPAVNGTSDYEVIYTSSNYGFWALDGDYLMIDGDVTYESGDWIVHNDASLKIIDGSGNEIIRLGTDTGEKGLFIYNTSHVQLAKYISDEIFIGTSGDSLQYTVGGGLVIDGGGITITLNQLDPDTPSSSGFYMDATHLGYYNGSSWDVYLDNAGNFYLGGAATDIYSTGQDEQTLNELLNDTPSSAGFYMDSTNLGFYNGSSWDVYLGSSGSTGLFYLGGTSGKLQWNGTTLSIEGAITITSGSGIANLTDAGDLAELDTINSSYITDVNAYTTDQDRISFNVMSISYPDTPSGAGLYLSATNLGYYDGGNWNVFLDNTGNFYLGGTSGELQWDGSTLLLGGDSQLAFGTRLVHGANIMAPDVRLWVEDSTPSEMGYFTDGSNPYGGDDNNAVVNTLNPWGQRDLIWECTPTVGDVLDGGWGYNSFTIDKDLRYRYSGWVKRTGSSDGGCYFGLNYSATHTSNLTADGSDDGNGNPYFISTFDLPNVTYFTTTAIINGTMEADSSWTSYNSPDSNIRSSTQAHGGTYSRRIIVNGERQGIYSNVFTIEEFITYRLSIWLYGDGNKWSVYVDDGSERYCIKDFGSDVLTPISGEWTQHVLHFQPRGRSTTTRVYIISADDHAGTLYIDDVEFYSDLIINGDVEEIESTQTAFTGWAHVGTPTYCERSTTQAHGGTYSWRITVNAVSEGVKTSKIQTANGTTTSTSSGNLVDSGASFDIDGTAAGDKVYNNTDNTCTTIDAVTNGTTLDLADNIMASGEAYIISSADSYIKLIGSYQYRCNIWLYGNASTEWYIKVSDGSNDYDFLETDNTTTLIPAASWTQYVLDFEAKENSESAYIEIISKGTSGTLYIDDVTFQETPWYLMVGYLHPDNYAGTESWGGMYHYKSGMKTNHIFTDFKSMATTTGQIYRFFFHDSSTITDNQYQYGPAIHVVDGSEPTLSAMLGNSMDLGWNIEGTTNISKYLIESPTIRGGDYASGNYIQLDGDGFRQYGSGIQIAEINKDGSGYFGKDNWRRIEWDKDGYSSARLMDYYLNADWRFYLLSSSGHATMYFENGGGSNQEEFKIIHNNTIDRLQLECTVSGTGTVATMIESNIDFGVQATTGDVKIQIGTEMTGAYNSSLDLLQDIGFGTTNVFGDTGVTGWSLNYDGSDTNDLQFISGNSTTTIIRMGIERDTGNIKIYNSTGDSTQMWTDTNGHFNIKPDGDHIKIHESAGDAGDIGDIYMNNSGILVINGGDANIVYIDDTLNVQDAYRQSGSDIINTSGHQTGAFRTMMPLAYGLDATVTNSDTWLKGAGNRNAGHYRLAYDATLVGITICTASGFTLGSGDTCPVIVYYWEGDSDTTSSTTTPLTLIQSDDGSYGKATTGLSIAFSAGDRISVRLEPDELTSISIPNPQVILYFVSKVV